MRAPQETLPPPRAVRKNKAKSLAGTPPARAVKAVKERKAKSSILEVPAPRAVKKHIKARGATIDALRSVSIGILKKRKKRSRQSSTSRERGEAKFIQGILVTPYVKSGTTENERMKAGRYAIADSLEEDELLLYTTPMGGKVFVGNQEGVDLIDQHAKQVTALEIKADSAEVVRIMLRHRFLSNYKKRFSKSLLYRADEVYINDGNRVAHRGDVLYDASLYLENKRTDHKTFVDAYGLAAKVAAGLTYDPIIDICNDHAAHMADMHYGNYDSDFVEAFKKFMVLFEKNRFNEWAIDEPSSSIRKAFDTFYVHFTRFDDKKPDICRSVTASALSARALAARAETPALTAGGFPRLAPATTAGPESTQPANLLAPIPNHSDGPSRPYTGGRPETSANGRGPAPYTGGGGRPSTRGRPGTLGTPGEPSTRGRPNSRGRGSGGVLGPSGASQPGPGRGSYMRR